MPSKPKKDVPKDNPADAKAFSDLEDDGKRYRVIHAGVARNVAGDVVSAKDFGPGAQIGRLLKIGAISELSEDEIEAHEKAQAEAAGEVDEDEPEPAPKPDAAKPDTAKPDAQKPSPTPHQPTPHDTKK